LTALDDDTPELSLVLACYNEAEHLPESVRQIRETLRGMGLRYELIFIDDCSRDGTPRLIEALCSGESDARCVMHTENVGRGGTVSEGFRLARGRIVGYIDVDLEVPRTASWRWPATASRDSARRPPRSACRSRSRSSPRSRDF
jgi:dolichol-phosphate mannosyltransferase